MIQKRLSCAALSLARYREVAAQLQQVPGVQGVELEPQGDGPFDYAQSQVRALLMTLADDRPPQSDRQLSRILDHYAQTVGPWEIDAATAP